MEVLIPDAEALLGVVELENSLLCSVEIFV
jgi:hypothetical protein